MQKSISRFRPALSEAKSPCWIGRTAKKLLSGLDKYRGTIRTNTEGTQIQKYNLDKYRKTIGTNTNSNDVTIYKQGNWDNN